MEFKKLNNKIYHSDKDYFCLCSDKWNCGKTLSISTQEVNIGSIKKPNKIFENVRAQFTKKNQIFGFGVGEQLSTDKTLGITYRG
jgi:hypothetical protein